MDAETVRAALRRRKAMDLGDTDAFRVCDGAEDGTPGIVLDAFGPHWVAQTLQRGVPASWRDLVGSECRSLWWKALDKEDKRPPECLGGEWPEGSEVSTGEAAPFCIREHGLKYEIRLTAGYSPGIFLDQRENRRRVREAVAASPGMRVLNLFSYTCGFSVAAAAGGAITTSVDLSPTYLEWGKRNLAHNGLDPARHFFVKGDSFEWLAQFARKGRRFAGIILDPPTFSRGIKKKVFRVEQDYPELVALAAAVAEPDGWLLCCANTRRLSLEEFQAQLRDGLRRVGIRQARLQPHPMPPDFSGEAYLKNVWVSLGQ